MELSRRYKVLLIRAKVNPIKLVEVRKNVKAASDLELVLIHSSVKNELIKRGILNGEE